MRAHAAAAVLALSACGGDSKPVGGAIDTALGTYRGVGVGDDVAAMHREFGPQAPAAEGERIVARSVGADNDYSPPVIQLPPLDSASPPFRAYLYEHVVFLVRGSRIGAVIVNADGARLDGGPVRIGSELAQARERYDVRCETAREGSEYEPFPACTGKLGPRRYLWFGGEPIRNVTILAVPPGGI
jgi:hypothetical protein